MGKIEIGTSGWVYKSWENRFYPDEINGKSLLNYYAHEFSTVEINSSFYRLPTASTYHSWANQVPGDFIFTVKASRFLTHMKRLHDASDSWHRVMDGAQELGGKLGPVLLQFPQSWAKNYDRLVEFFETVEHSKDEHPKLVFEFRDESWHSQDVLKLLEEHGAAWCIADSYKFKRFDTVTTDLAYFRYHGRQMNRAPNYSRDQLKKEALKIKRLAARGIDVFAYFNNDAEGYAIKNARTLKDLVA